jgi:purine-nucleoside phosphorylase
MTISRSTFDHLHSLRYEEWLAAARKWVFGTPEITQEIGPYLILIHSSAEFPDKMLLPFMEDVTKYGGFPIQGGGCASGIYRGTKIWILHQFMGVMATQMWIECLKDTKVKYLIGLAEMTAYPQEVKIGDIVVPTSAIRGDLVTDFHAPPEVPAASDGFVHGQLVKKLRTTGWSVHEGIVYTGNPGGVGVQNPIIRERIWKHMQSGVLGNAMEASVTLLEAKRLDIRAAEVWTVSDDMDLGLMDDAPEVKRRWEEAAGITAHAALEVLADIAQSEKGSSSQ